MTSVPLTAYLVVAALLFGIGAYAIVAQRGAVMVLMGIELVLSAIGLNIIAFWRHVAAHDHAGQVFAIVVITIGAIEMAVGLAIMMLLRRTRGSVQVDAYQELRG